MNKNMLNKKNNIILKNKNYSVTELSQLTNIKIKNIIKFFFLKSININYFSYINISNIKLLLTSKKIIYKFDIDENNEVTQLNNLLKKQNNKTTIQTNQNKEPIITIIGHVNHGKTHLLENICEKNLIKKEIGSITQNIVPIVCFINKKKLFFLDTPGHSDFNSFKQTAIKISDMFLIVISINETINQYIKNIMNLLFKNNKIFLIIFTFFDNNSTKNQQKLQKRLIELSELQITPDLNNIYHNKGNIESILISNTQKINLNICKNKILNNINILNLNIIKHEKGNQANIFIISSFLKNNMSTIILKIISGQILKNHFIYQNKLLIGKIQIIKNLNNQNLNYANPNSNIIVKIYFKKTNNIIKIGEAYIMKTNKTNNILNNNLFTIKPFIFSDNLPNVIIKTNTIEDIDMIKNILIKKQYVNIININNNDIKYQDIQIFQQFTKKSKIIKIIFYKNNNNNNNRFNTIEIKKFNILYKMLDYLEQLNKKYVINNNQKIKKNIAQIIKIFIIKKHIIAGCKLISGIFKINQSIKILRKNKIIYKNITIKSLKIKNSIKTIINETNTEFGIQFNQQTQNKQFILKINDIIEISS